MALSPRQVAGLGDPYVALTPDGYEDLSTNMAELIRYIIDLQTYVKVIENDHAGFTNEFEHGN